jgi:hypothetical protein
MPIRVRYTIRNRWLTILMLYEARTVLRFAPALVTFEVFQFFGALRRGWLAHWAWAVGSMLRALPCALRRRAVMRSERRRADLEVLVDGPFPYNKLMPRGALDRAAQRALDMVARLNWRIAGGRAS